MKKELKYQGFSLLELLVGLFLTGMLLLLWATSRPAQSPRMLLDNGAREIQARLYHARYHAVLGGQKVRISFNEGVCTTELYSAARNLWERKETRLIEGVHIEANNRPIFHPAGTVSNLATIRIINSAGEYRITLAISGRIRMTKV